MRDDIASAAVARARLASDALRPQLHFTAPANWLNDPNGLIQWHGRYHLFYQYHPFSAQWGRIHWGHAVSDDLAHWSDLPIALTPDPAGADADGCWSGCLVDDAGVPTIIYTGVRAGVEGQCVATGDDALVAWRKHPGNPVIAAPPAGLETLGFRDPCVWREGDGWRMLLATGLRGRGGAALLYASPDLLHWTYLHPLLAADEVGELGEPGELGEIWECPGLFPLGDPAGARHLLLISTLPARRTLAFIGRYAGQRFIPERLTPLDAGPSFYAPQAFRDARGRLLLFGWLQETQPEAAALAAGWSGAISAPRILSRLPDGALGMDVAPEWEALRRAPDPTPGLALADVPLAPGAALDLPLLPGGCFEAQVDYAAGATDGVVELRSSGERLTIAWERHTGALALRGPGADASSARSAPCPDDEPIHLRLLVDRSIVEVFVNQRICGAWRFYPADPMATRARVVAGAAGAQISAIRQWRLSL